MSRLLVVVGDVLNVSAVAMEPNEAQDYCKIQDILPEEES